MRLRMFCLVLVVWALSTATSYAAAPSLVSYQGVLTDGSGAPEVGGPFSITFSIYDDAAATNPALWSETQAVTTDAEGRFSVLMGENTPLTDDIFTGADRWLGISVESDPEMSPRQRLCSVAYALRSSTIDGASGGTVFGNVTIGYNLTVGGSATIGSGHTVTASSSFVVGNNHTVSGDFATVVGRENSATAGDAIVLGAFNGASGVGAAVVGGYYNGAMGSRSCVGGGESNEAVADYSTVSGGRYNLALGDLSIVGGGEGNVASGRLSVVCGGGGGGYGHPDSNTASGWYSAIGGGYRNLASGLASVVSGGRQNRANGDYAFVGGGNENVASAGLYAATVCGGFADTAVEGSVGGGIHNVTVGGTIAGGSENRAGNYGTIGGGSFNNALGGFSTIGGGQLNSLALGTADYSTVGGGVMNAISGQFSTIPGGESNAVEADHAFAAGTRAKARTAGSFVWADHEPFDFPSTEESNFSEIDDNFLIRASGGAVLVSGIDGSGNSTSGVILAPGGGAWSMLSDRNAKEQFESTNGREILARLALIPIGTWKYKAQDDSIRHIGPMAQDFYAAFGVGEDNRHITTVDADGVALAAIQALKAENDDLRAQIAELREIVGKLTANEK